MFHSYFLSAYSVLGTVQGPGAKVLYKVREIRSKYRNKQDRLYSHDAMWKIMQENVRESHWGFL